MQDSCIVKDMKAIVGSDEFPKDKNKRRSSIKDTLSTISCNSTKVTRSFRSTLDHYFQEPHESRTGIIIQNFFLTVILLNMVVLCAETLDGPNNGSSQPNYPYLPSAETYNIVDGIFTIIFSVEISIRIFTARSQKLFWRDLLTWCDVAAIIPFYLTLIQGSFFPDIDGAKLKTIMGKVKLFRVLRVVKVARHFDGTKILATAIIESTRPLTISLFFLIVLVMMFATALFFVEPCYNLETCTFTDIFNAGYYVIVTVTTVGYGDQVPDLNNLAAVVISVIAILLGSLFLSMPLAIIGIKFQEAWSRYEISNSCRMISKIPVKNPQIVETSIASGAHFIVNEDYYALIEALESLYFQFVNFFDKSHSSDHQFKYMLARVQKCHKLHCRMFLNFCELLDKDSKVKFCADELNGLDDDSDRRQSSVNTAFARAKKVFSANNKKLTAENHIKLATESTSYRDKLWLLMEVPDSSMTAIYINKFLLFCVITSVVLFYWETMPELQAYGHSSQLCKNLVRQFCDDKENPSANPGCFYINTDWTPSKTKILYDCGGNSIDPICYGSHRNFGSSNLAAANKTCEDYFSTAGIASICDRRQCNNNHVPIFSASGLWIYFEFFFGIVFSAELFIRLYVCRCPKDFYKDSSNIIDFGSVLPFYMEIADLIITGRLPEYDIVASNPSFLSLMRMLKTMRILKLTRHFSGATVLINTLQLSWKRLTIPLFFLFIASVICGAMFYEIERGTECFVGKPCTWWNKQVLTPELSYGLPEGKRILIQNFDKTIITDMLRSSWLALVTFTSVGYGRLYPRTAIGKLLSMFVSIFGAFYTSMPLSLVGGQFYSCYEELIEKENSEKKKVGVDTEEEEILEQDAIKTISISTDQAIKIREFQKMDSVLVETAVMLEEQLDAHNATLSTANILTNIESNINLCMGVVLGFAEIIDCVRGSGIETFEVEVEDK